MTRWTNIIPLVIVIVVGLTLLMRRAESPPAQSGRIVEDFSLRDHRGLSHSLHDLRDKRLVVVVFLGTQCPLARAYAPRLAELAEQFGPRSVAFLGIDSNSRDSLAEISEFVHEQKTPFPILKDSNHLVADQFQAERTPEVFVLDEQRAIRYQGRIDDRFALGIQRPLPTRHDLREALNELLAGRAVTQPHIAAVGCRIGRSPKIEPHGDITYSRHVAPILQRRCVECHRPGQIAPFPLTDYADAVNWAAMMIEVVEEGRMPPWSASADHGRFRNDPRLTVTEKAILQNWVKNGCPKGDDVAPPTVTFADGWRIPEPDRVLFMAEQPFSVPATGDVDYQYFLVDPGFEQDVFIKAAEVRPDRRSVVHHALVLLVPPGGKRSDADSLGAMLDYAPGMPPMLLQDGDALHVAAGSKFLFQMHYTPNGTAQHDRSSLGLVFADPKTVRQRVRGGAVVNSAIEIPPGDSHHRLTAEWHADEDLLIVSLSPHLHLRGKSFRFEALHPDGRREVLLDVPRYDFHWQLRYELVEPILLKRGGKLICTAVWDNSKRNPNNPDATKTVVWGDQTTDEMLIGFFSAIPQ